FTAAEAIEQLLAAQISLRNNRRLQTAMRSSRLPAIKTLGQFDFAFQPSIRREQIESLHELGFIKRRENVILLGPPGVRKTHLAISLAIAAAQSGRRVYYGTFVSLIESAKACILLRRRHGGRRRAGRRTQASVPHLEPNGIPPPEHIVEILVRADPRPAERRPAGNERRILVEHVRDVRERLPLAAPSE